MEIAVISGKGGTGKSSISAAFATLSEKVVLADCDVDAANLYLIFNPTHEEEQVYIGGQKAEINYSLCTNCNLCIDYCRFSAISFLNDKVIISETSCDGCKLCARICPTEAITMINSDKSRMYSGAFRNGKMVYGRLAPGEENSGKLVNIVREKAKTIARSENIETIIIDGPPGIGCPVISTITGVDHVVIVTEPTISGMHDLKRTIEITSKFNLKTWVIINKYDLNYDMANQIEAYCNSLNIKVAGKFSFDPIVVEAMVNCKSIMEWAPKSNFSIGVKSAFKLISNKSLPKKKLFKKQIPVIDITKCTNCGKCKSICPTNAIEKTISHACSKCIKYCFYYEVPCNLNRYIICGEKCDSCGLCVSVCEEKAIYWTKTTE